MKYKKIFVRLNDIGLFLFVEDVIFLERTAYFFRRHISDFISKLHLCLTHFMPGPVQYPTYQLFFHQNISTFIQFFAFIL